MGRGDAPVAAGPGGHAAFPRSVVRAARRACRGRPRRRLSRPCERRRRRHAGRRSRRPPRSRRRGGRLRRHRRAAGRGDRAGRNDGRARALARRGVHENLVPDHCVRARFGGDGRGGAGDGTGGRVCRRDPAPSRRLSRLRRRRPRGAPVGRRPAGASPQGDRTDARSEIPAQRTRGMAGARRFEDGRNRRRGDRAWSDRPRHRGAQAGEPGAPDAGRHRRHPRSAIRSRDADLSPRGASATAQRQAPRRRRGCVLGPGGDAVRRARNSNRRTHRFRRPHRRSRRYRRGAQIPSVFVEPCDHRQTAFLSALGRPIPIGPRSLAGAVRRPTAAAGRLAHRRARGEARATRRRDTRAQARRGRGFVRRAARRARNSVSISPTSRRRSRQTPCSRASGKRRGARPRAARRCARRAASPRRSQTSIRRRDFVCVSPAPKVRPSRACWK